MVGVSFDHPAANKLFRTNEGFQYPLWSDTKRELALVYGAAKTPSQPAAKRVTVILDPSGTWALVYPNVDATLFDHVTHVLEDMAAIAAAN